MVAPSGPSEPLAVDATTRIRREAHRQVTDRDALHEISTRRWSRTSV